MVYTPRNPPAALFEANPELALWLQDEFRDVARAGQEAPEVRFNVLHVPPTKPRPGMTVYADGTNWNPGDGEGLYTFVDDAWIKDNNNPPPDVAGAIADALDAFDEGGNWTPELNFDGDPSGIGYDELDGVWRREGRLVHVTALLVLNSKGTNTGGAYISGLPFALASDTIVTTFSMFGSSFNSAAIPMVCSYQPIAYPFDSFFYLYANSDGGNYQINNDNFNDDTVIILSGTYVADPL